MVARGVPTPPLSFLTSRRVSGANTPIYGAQRRELRSVFFVVQRIQKWQGGVSSSNAGLYRYNCSPLGLLSLGSVATSCLSSCVGLRYSADDVEVFEKTYYSLLVCLIGHVKQWEAAKDIADGLAFKEWGVVVSRAR